MKKKNVAKHLISVAVAVAAVFSLGCIALADEDNPDFAVPDAEETVAADEEIVSQEASDAGEKGTGFYKEDGVWYYYVDGKRQYYTGWIKIDGDWYFLDYDAMMTGGITDYNSEHADFYILGLDGKILKGWQQWNGDWYYLENNGKAVRGWKQISGKWYYFVEDKDYTPRMVKDALYSIVDKDGTLYTYLFAKSGAMLTGWQEFNDSWYYLDNVGHAAVGWKQLGGKWYYFSKGSTPYMYRGGINKIYADNSDSVYGYYGFDENGVLLTGWNYLNDMIFEMNGEKIHSGSLFYFDSTGKAATGWKKIDGKWYYFYENGTPNAYRGYNSVDGKYYYFDINTGAMFNGGWFNISSVINPYYYPYYYYYYYSSYSMQDQWVYFGSDGAAYTEWQQIGGQWYYFGKADDIYMRTGKQKIDGKYYYFGDSGVMRKGWIKADDKYYYADPTGALVTDQWYLSGGKTYYFFEDGTMATGYQKIPRTYSGKVYDFGTDGVCRNP